ncbi:MAG: hypothetical protein IPL78_33435 [Chloroflexi bacterium]|nr:hypothetical protein [Chloroflexota bacterium]
MGMGIRRIDDSGAKWLRTAVGGLLMTCGLSYGVRQGVAKGFMADSPSARPPGVCRRALAGMSMRCGLPGGG